MSQRLPRITSTEMSRAVEKAGFLLVRQSGSHRIYKNSEGKRITIPHHSGRILHPKILLSILRDAELTVEELAELLG